MVAHKLYLEGKRIQQRAAALSSAALPGKDKIDLAEGLLQEIDDLALLLDQVKEQSDRIQAIADAIGDSVLANAKPGSGPARRSKPELSAAAKARPRLRLERLMTSPSVADVADN